MKSSAVVSKQTIIVDDDAIVLFLMEKMIQRLEIGGEQHSFILPQQALQYLRENYSPEQFYLIFLDINMPEINGWQFIEELQTFASAENTNVYIITSSTDPQDEKRAADIPFIRRFIIKPVQAPVMMELREELQKQLKRA